MDKIVIEENQKIIAINIMPPLRGFENMFNTIFYNIDSPSGFNEKIPKNEIDISSINEENRKIIAIKKMPPLRGFKNLFNTIFYNNDSPSGFNEINA